MGVCVCGQPIGLIPRACRVEDRALLWPPVRVNADGSEHRCALPKRRPFRVVEPVPPAVQAALITERASAETSGAVTRLATVLADEAEARTGYYRSRTAARPATAQLPRPSVPQEQQEAPSSSPATPAPQPTQSLSDRLQLEDAG